MRKQWILILLLYLMVAILFVLILVLKSRIQEHSDFIIVISVILFIQLLIIVFAIIKCNEVCRKRKLASGGEASTVLGYSYLHKVAGTPKKFSYTELQMVTANFSTLVGRGGCATVYKGVLEDGTEVAVKVLRTDFGLKEFKSEVSAIANLQHRYLVRLMGFCAHSSYKILIYEFLPNGSLNNWIFDNTHRSRAITQTGGVLGWPERYGVAVGVAKALAYMHHDCRSKVLHLDIKPENVLLDACFEAKLSDFGLAKLMGRDESKVLTTIRGTRGYLAPEWLLENGISEKCDVYSFGMLILEIIGGRRNVSRNAMNPCLSNTTASTRNSMSMWTYFPKVVRNKVKEGRFMDIVDQRLPNESIVEEQLRRLTLVSLWCIQEKARLRPSMKKVVDMLEGRCQVDDPPETKMIIVDLLGLEEVSNGSSPDTSRASATSGSDSQQGTNRRNYNKQLSYTYSMSIVSPR